VNEDGKRRRRQIRRHSALLLTAMAALLSYCGWIVGEWDGILWSLMVGAMMLVLARRIPPERLLHAIGARPVARWEAPRLYEILEALCRRAGLNRIGVVTLDGDVIGLGQKRLAGALAWWVPGSRDVINGLGVTPPEVDNDFEIADAVRLVLEKDPFVNADQLRVGVRNAVVALDGIVPTADERDMARARRVVCLRG
jgi:hypothetical protein